MTKIDPRARFYTVVEVWRGIAAGAHSFRRLKDALLCAEQLREGRDLQEDDVQVFESRMDSYRKKE